MIIQYITMFKGLLVIVAALVACQGSIIPEETPDVRNARSVNSYYYFHKDRPFVAVPINSLTSTTLVSTTNFNPLLTTIIIIHGHSGNAFTTLNPMVKDAFFSNAKGEEVNIIVVDWSLYAGQTYTNAAGAVPLVGRYLAEYIDEVLDDITDFSLDNLHLVGFGLGAHVAGVAGRQLNGAVRKITALDPSGNLWGSNSDRLNRNDAQLVEVIHTDGVGVLANGIGQALGHIDFFVNGATLQPGCFTNECNHNRAYEVFAASLTDGNHFGNECNTMLEVTINTCIGSRLEMGNTNLVKYGSGIYRVNTGRIYPYNL